MAPEIHLIVVSAPLAIRLVLPSETPNKIAPKGRLKPIANIANRSIAQITFPCRMDAPSTINIQGLHGREQVATNPPIIIPANAVPNFPELFIVS